MRLSPQPAAGNRHRVNLGSVIATVKVRLNPGGQIITASITKEAVEDPGLTEGTPTTRAGQSTEVMLAVE